MMHWGQMLAAFACGMAVTVVGCYVGVVYYLKDMWR